MVSGSYEEWKWGRKCLMSLRFPFEVMKVFWSSMVVMVHSTVNVLTALSLYT